MLEFRPNFGFILDAFGSQNGCQNEPQNIPKKNFGAQGPPRGLQGAILEPFWLHFGPPEASKLTENHQKYKISLQKGDEPTHSTQQPRNATQRTTQRHATQHATQLATQHATQHGLPGTTFDCFLAFLEHGERRQKKQENAKTRTTPTPANHNMSTKSQNHKHANTSEPNNHLQRTAWLTKRGPPEAKSRGQKSNENAVRNRLSKLLSRPL